MERDAPSPEPMVYSFVISVRVPSWGALPWNGGKTYNYRSRSPTQMEGLHTMGCGLVPQGNRLQHCYHYPSAMQPSAWFLPPWLAQTTALLASMCHSNPEQGIHFIPVTASHVTQGTNPHDHGVQKRGCIYGRASEQILWYIFLAT